MLATQAAGKFSSFPQTRKEWITGLTLFGIALILRLLFVIEFSSSCQSLINLLPGTDMETYIAWGREISSGEIIGTRVFWQAPLYPYTAGAVLWMTGGSIAGVMVFQAFLGACTALVVFLAARMCMPLLFAAIAGGMFALYDASIFFSGITLTAVQGTFLGSLVMWCMLIAFRMRLLRYWGILGISVGIASLARPNFLLFAVIIPAVLLWKGWRDAETKIKISLTATALFLLAGLCFVLPVTIRNRAVTGTWTLISANGPETFRLANSYDSRVFNFVYPQKPAMPVLSFPFLMHQVKKAFGFWIALEWPQNANMYLYKQESFILRIPFLAGFALITAMGICGMVFVRDKSRMFPLYLYAAVYLVSIIPFYVISRFRLPVVPVFAVFAGAGCRFILESFKKRSGRVWAGVGTAAAVFAYSQCLVFMPPVQREFRTMKIINLNNLSASCMRADLLEETKTWSEASLSLLPEQAVIEYRLAWALVKSGDIDGSALHCGKAVLIDPDYAPPYRLLGNIWLKVRNNPQKAEEYYALYEKKKTRIKVESNKY